VLATSAPEAQSGSPSAILDTRQKIAAALFLLLALYMTTVVPTIEIAWVTCILLLTIYLFAFEVVGVDVAAVTVMVVLGLTSLLAPLMGLEQGLVDNNQLFDGFSSNAVISIIAVMIIGAGLDKTGLMGSVANFILRVGGTTERRIIPIISSTVGIISSFMQNVGAAALFLPVVARISARTGLPMSRLLMPMGFCAILGGTVTMVGSSPLILLNDLIITSNHALPESQQMEGWSLFSVTPIGLALVVSGILYFVLAGRFILPAHKSELVGGAGLMDYFDKTYGVNAFDAYELVVTHESPVAGLSIDELERLYRMRVIAVNKGDGVRIGTDAIDRNIGISDGTILGVLSSAEEISNFAEKTGVYLKPVLDVFADALSPNKSGIAEIVLPPSSNLIGKSARDLWLRKSYGISLLAIRRGDTLINYKQGGLRDTPFLPSDTLMVHTLWTDLGRLAKDRNFVVITTEYPHEELRPHKVPYALTFFFITLALVLFSELRLSVALLSGAVGMILSRVLTIEEAYQAVSWKTVFLLASLIPLGLAVETSGTAKWIAEQTLNVVGEMPIWVIQSAVALLATFFTLVMSNVGATVLLVPLAVNIAIGVGADPAVFALTVAIATSNSFLLPTHQVNALIMGPAGYRVPDFLRAGSIMTVLFLVVMMSMMTLLF
jgi:di/tricarboxylate transporter